MRSNGTTLAALILLPVLGGCDSLFHGFSIVEPEPPRRPAVVVETQKKLAEPVVGDPQVIPLLKDVPRSSVNLVRVQGEVAPHYHAKSDETVYILEGEGELLLDRAWRPVTAGTLIHVPMNVPHAFINRASGGTIVLSTFTPPLVPGDRVQLKVEPRTK